MKIVVGGLYVPEAEPIVSRLLTPRKDADPPMILDVGSGSGIW